MRIAVLHPGVMGAAVGAQLIRAGHEVVWLPAGRSSATHRRAADAGLWAVSDLAGCDAVFSIMPPDAVTQVAQSVAGFTGLYVDANAIAPDTAEAVAAIAAAGGATAVDAGIVGPPPTHSGTTRLFLSGDRADDVAALFAGTNVEPVVLHAAPTAASALKMAYGSWTKGTAALLLAVHATASHFEVAEALEQEWARSQPDLPTKLQQAREAAAAKGWRWVPEMQENARTYLDAGQPSGFGLAAAEIYQRHERHERPDQG